MTDSSSPRLHDVQCSTAAGLHRMAYREWGDRDNTRVLVCVHGLTRVSNDFDNLARSLANDYRVVCPDVVGRGRSGWLRDPKLYHWMTYVTDMVTLLARCDAKTVHWIGTSLGGFIGMVLASLPDSPIDRLILNEAGPVIGATALTRIGSYVGETPRFATMKEADAYVRRVAAPFGEHTDDEWRFLTKSVFREDNGAWIRSHDPGIAVPIEKTVNTDTVIWNVYDAVRCPTLAVRGEHSDLLSEETHAEMATRGPHAQLVTIPNVGHAPTFMHDDQIAIAKDFLLAA